MITILGKLMFIFRKVTNKLIKEYEKTLFKSIGKNVNIGNNCIFTNSTITIGDNVQIGNLCILQSSHGNIVIGNNIMFGPGVHIHGGNHIYDRVGVYMNEVHDKNMGQDGNVIIEDDVWIGANSIILPNITIGTGSIIAAGSIVTKNVEPYTIVGGNPAKFIKMRFEHNNLEKHLYEIAKRDK